MRRLRGAWLGLLLLPAPAVGQSVAAGASVLLGSPVGSQLSLGYQGRPLGPADLTLGGTYIGGLGGGRWGLAAELGLFRTGGKWYGTGGFAAGFGTGSADDWAAWSAGLGLALRRNDPVRLAVELRYLHLSIPDDAIAAGLRVTFGRRSPPAPESPPAAIALPVARSPAVQAVIQTALDVMGTPYLWGGSDANGFDCSGLIQYAYGQHGVVLPRRSVDQARSGTVVPTDPAALLPGDILVFGQPGGPVSHVGLYLGEGRFLHSATGGVGVSTLRPDDPEGRYWYSRWLGARRLLPDPGSP